VLVVLRVFKKPSALLRTTEFLPAKLSACSFLAASLLLSTFRLSCRGPVRTRSILNLHNSDAVPAQAGVVDAPAEIDGVNLLRNRDENGTSTVSPSIDRILTYRSGTRSLRR
jgi:hypothetical protein